MLGRLGGAMIGSGSETMRGAGSRTGATRPRPPAWLDPRRPVDLAGDSASRRLPPSRTLPAGSRRSFPGADFFGRGMGFLFEIGAAFLPGEDFFGAGAARLETGAFFSAF